LVDRFSINLQLERRLVYSEDPLWPALTLVGTLPKLNFHLNEFKVLSVRGVLSGFVKKEVASAGSGTDSAVDLSFLSGSQINLQDPSRETKERRNDEDGWSGEELDRKNDSKLFVAEFTIQSVSVDLQSRGRNIAELQIVGTKTILTRREEDTEFSFVIQSLLLADAVQTFGPDFQLLLASHRHVW
jgi:vacuolar protein sorting-associated protein 13D